MRSVNEYVDKLGFVGYTNQDFGRNTFAHTDTEDHAIEYVKQMTLELFQRYNVCDSEYEIREDAFGNLFVTLYGEDRSKTIGSGSHVDSVKSGGRYDGPVGVGSAIHFLERLLESGRKPAQNYTVVAFRSEESSPTTGYATLGSAIATGQITPDTLNAIEYKKVDGSVESLREYFSKRYSPERWERVLDEAVNPIMTPDNYKHFEEVHIEQSKVAQLHDADVGIVQEGISGSRRERLEIPVSSLHTETIENTEAISYDRFTITIEGYADHTGGTPHNGTDLNGRKHMIYRRDALLSAAHTLQVLIAPYFGGSAKVVSMKVPETTGFTTVPAIQTIEIVSPSNKTSDIEKRLAGLKTALMRSGLTMQYSTRFVQDGEKVDTIDTVQALAAVHIPLAVENKATSTIIRHQFDNRLQKLREDADPIGKVRATVTDFSLTSDGGFQCNIDQRNVHAMQADELSAGIDADLQRYLHLFDVKLDDVRTIVSQAPHGPIDKESVNIKRRIAEDLGLRTVFMPSMAGHDAVNTSKSGIPTSMTFVRHNGISHNPDEYATPEDIERATLLSHGLLAELLKVDVGIQNQVSL